MAVEVKVNGETVYTFNERFNWLSIGSQFGELGRLKPADGLDGKLVLDLEFNIDLPAHAPHIDDVVAHTAETALPRLKPEQVEGAEFQSGVDEDDDDDDEEVELNLNGES